MKLAFRAGSICDKKVVVAGCCRRDAKDTIVPAGLDALAVANLNSFRAPVRSPVASSKREHERGALWTLFVFFLFFFLILIFEKEFLIRLKMLDTSDSKNFEFKLSFGNRYRDESVSNDVSVIYIHVHIYIYIR